MITLRQAVNRSVVLRLKYFPNADGSSRVGWRTVLPLDLWSYRGVQYLLGWFSDGSSVSGTKGFRMYLVENIQEFEEAETEVQQPFAMMKKFHAEQKPNWSVACWMMVKRGKVE